MYHHQNMSLPSQEDCKDMAFFSASSTSKQKYTFKKIHEAEGNFEPKDNVGSISLKHCCFFKIFKRRNAQTRNQREYSIRLYRNINSVEEGISAVFCVCPSLPPHTTYCDEAVMKYSGMSNNRISFIVANITKKEVEIKAEDQRVMYDRTPKIERKEIDLLENNEIDVSDLKYYTYYPARISIYVQREVASTRLNIYGLHKKDSYFTLYGTAGTGSATRITGATAMPAAISAVTIRYLEKDCPSSVELTFIKAKNGNTFRLFERIAGSYKKIAGTLGIEHYKVTSIERENRDYVSRVEKVFQEWFNNANQLPYKQHFPLTWNGLEELLNNSELSAVASDFFAFLKDC